VRGGAKLVVAFGGDGTLNEAVNGVLRAGGDAELATIPLGTGMDFARTHGIPTRFDDAVRAVVDGASTSAASRTAPGLATPPSATSTTSRVRG
jgi:diacylglycerol kinase family enzyme